MFLLSVAVLCNLLIALCFKLYDKFRVDHFTAIIINYIASATLGGFLSGKVALLSYAPGSATWTWFAMGLGICFIVGFTITGLSVKFAGMAITTAMQRMSLLLSAGYALVFYNEAATVWKICGMLLSVAAIFMITRKEKSRQNGDALRFLYLPLGTLLFAGIIESTLYHVHANEIATAGDIIFTTYAFSFAACAGIIAVIFRSLKGYYTPAWRDLAGGVALGLPNFFTIYLILTLLQNGFPGSVLYPVLNILVLAVTAVTGLFFFREKLGKVNIIGIGLALLAILLVSLGGGDK